MFCKILSTNSIANPSNSFYFGNKLPSQYIYISKCLQCLLYIFCGVLVFMCFIPLIFKTKHKINHSLKFLQDTWNSIFALEWNFSNFWCTHFSKILLKLWINYNLIYLIPSLYQYAYISLYPFVCLSLLMVHSKNNQMLYIHWSSNHAWEINKQLPNFISERLSKNTSNGEIFNTAKVK